MSDEWIPARKSALAAGGACSPVSSKKGESSGSRFYMLEGTNGEGGCSRQMSEIEAAVCKQLGYMLAPLPIPEMKIRVWD
ncbi:hypothetical protein Dimus_028483, partial [Dionaea muscipula]